MNSLQYLDRIWIIKSETSLVPSLSSTPPPPSANKSYNQFQTRLEKLPLEATPSHTPEGV